MGVFQDTRQWVETISKYLTIAVDKHEMLNADIQYKDILSQFKCESQLQGNFKSDVTSPSQGCPFFLKI